jgi:hypothetical protein
MKKIIARRAPMGVITALGAFRGTAHRPRPSGPGIGRRWPSPRPRTARGELNRAGWPAILSCVGRSRLGWWLVVGGW